MRPLIFAALVHGASSVIPLEGGRPRINTGGSEIQWSEGGPALSSTRFMRVSLRGIFTKNSELRSMNGWTVAPCNLSAFSLCHFPAGDVFPAKPYFGGSMIPHPYKGLSCSNDEGKVLSGRNVYDFSACDILDEGVDVIIKDQKLWFSKTNLDYPSYLCLLITSAFLIRGLSVNMQFKRKTENQIYVVVGCLVCLLIICKDGDRMYATASDVTFYYACLIYVLVYCFYHLFNIYKGGNQPIFNLVAGTLQLVAVRLYNGAETPYNPAILFVVASRTLQKMMGGSWLQLPSCLLDSFYLSLVCDGFVQDKRLLVPIFLASYLYTQTVNSLIKKDLF